MNRTVSIGIPAYNESQNIQNILRDILDQKQENIEILQIVIISDGSTDLTVEKILEIKDDRIILIDEKERLGKPVRFNQLLKLCQGDYIFLTDADVLIKDKNLLQDMINKFGDRTGLICGNHKPLGPKTYAEKVFYEGIKSWNKSLEILGEAGDMYFCTGRSLCLSRTFIDSLQLPDDLYAGIDRYIFLFAKQNNFEVKIAKNSFVYYKLPSNFRDYLKQMTRFVAIPRLMHYYFGEKIFLEYETMSGNTRIEGILKTISLDNFYLVVSYTALQIVAIIRSVFYRKDPRWNIAISSKELAKNDYITKM